MNDHDGTPQEAARTPRTYRGKRFFTLIMSALPTGTITFLFTDIEGSTRLWEEHPNTMREALARHDARPYL